MKRVVACGALALATILLCFNFPAWAQQPPAVSAPNGKLEFDAGALTLPSPVFIGRAAGTFTLPIGDRFGIQADFSVSTEAGFTGSTALHIFTRDPASYLIGGTLGYVRTPGANVVAAGPEAELYLGQWTLEAWGGAVLSVPTAPASPSRIGLFGMGGVGYYPAEDWKLSLDVSSLDSYNAIQFGSEYLLRNFDLPVSVTGTTRVGQDGAVRILLGLRGYLGPDPSKSLIRRHREDDPADRAEGLMAAVGDTSKSTTTTSENSVGQSESNSDDGQSTTSAPYDPPPLSDYERCLQQAGSDAEEQCAWLSGH